eukprot:scaffold41905_cov30-Tisochrysis_lutea.AAC.2
MRGSFRNARISSAVPAEVQRAEPAREVAHLLVPHAHCSGSTGRPRAPVICAVRRDHMQVTAVAPARLRLARCADSHSTPYADSPRPPIRTATPKTRAPRALPG